MKRGGPLKRKTRFEPGSIRLGQIKAAPVGTKFRKPMPRVSKRRAAENRKYGVDRKAYLEKHPFCQITLAELRITEADVRAIPGWDGTVGKLYYNGVEIPAATEIHHRNKARGLRKLDQRWWMAAARAPHERLEFDLHRSRKEGFVLAFEADADGKNPDGSQALTTDELLNYRAFVAKRDRAALSS